MSGDDRVIATMAAFIYAVKCSHNVDRKRLDTLRRQAIYEAIDIFNDAQDIIQTTYDSVPEENK